MGHLFVVHADLLKLDVDELLLPCDGGGHVMEHWRGFADGQEQRRAELRRTRRVTERHVVNGRAVRYVNTGAVETVEWLAQGVRAGVGAAVEDLQQTDRPDRPPLLGMPVFGVGAGGFNRVRGKALRAQLTIAAEAVAGVEVDAVIVCFERADFAALQTQRAQAEWPLPDDIVERAAGVAEAVMQRQAVLFIGAGVSKSAGLPTFAELAGQVERAAARSRGLIVDSSGTEAQRFERLVAATDKEYVKELVGVAVRRDRYSLSHALLASLRVREAITTNFDALYERACEQTFAPDTVDVLPWGRTSDHNPWLFKIHGDPARSGDLVLTQPTYDDFDAQRGPVAGVVRAMFTLSRQVIFVGYSMRDENIVKLVEEVVRFHHEYGVSHDRLGTLITLEEGEITEHDGLPLLRLRRVGTSIDDAARDLQIFLDCIAWRIGESEASWLLDERYEALLVTDDERQSARGLRTQPVPDEDRWSPVRTSLESFGRRRLRREEAREADV